MHRTRVPLLSWLQAIYLIVASSKGISAVKLAEMLDVSYPTAWFMGHRIRAMMAEANPILAGVVELDEMYAGAPPGSGRSPPATTTATTRPRTRRAGAPSARSCWWPPNGAAT